MRMTFSSQFTDLFANKRAVLVDVGSNFCKSENTPTLLQLSYTIGSHIFVQHALDTMDTPRLVSNTVQTYILFGSFVSNVIDFKLSYK